MTGLGMTTGYKFCPQCAAELISQHDGERDRLRCAACSFTHWNNPTPVLAAIIELADQGGQLLLARNAAWPEKMFGLVTGFMEAGESPEDGIRREIAEETSLAVSSLSLVGVHEFTRMNQVIITYHAVANGPIVLSPELVEYKLLPADKVKCWPMGTGLALAQWLRGRGLEPQWLTWSA